MRAVALLGLLSFGCSEEVRVVAQSGDIAVGSRFRFAVVDTSCDNSGATSFTVTLAAGLAFEAFVTSEGHPVLALPPVSTAPFCRKIVITKISEAASSAPETLEVVDTAVDRGVALVEVEARAAGSADVAVTVETAGGPRTASVTLNTARVAHVSLTAGCPADTEEGFIPVGAVSGYQFALAGAAGQPLLGYGYVPLAPSGLAISHPTFTDAKGQKSTDFRYLNITWPTSPADLTLTSPDDAAFKKPITLYDQSAYTAVDFEPGPGTVVALDDKYGQRFDAIGHTGNRKSCWYDPIPRHYFTDTPAVCDISLGLGSPKALDLTASGVVVYGLAAGTCVLHAEVPQTAFAPTLDITIQ